MGSVNPHTLKFLPWAFFKQALLKVEFKIYVYLHNSIWGQLNAKISDFIYTLYTMGIKR